MAFGFEPPAHIYRDPSSQIRYPLPGGILPLAPLHEPQGLITTDFRDGKTIVDFRHVDVGGGAPGSYFAGAREVYQEGLRLPPVKLVEAGRTNKAVIDKLKEPGALIAMKRITISRSENEV